MFYLLWKQVQSNRFEKYIYFNNFFHFMLYIKSDILMYVSTVSVVVIIFIIRGLWRWLYFHSLRHILILINCWNSEDTINSDFVVIWDFSPVHNLTKNRTKELYFSRWPRDLQINDCGLNTWPKLRRSNNLHKSIILSILLLIDIE